MTTPLPPPTLLSVGKKKESISPKEQAEFRDAVKEVFPLKKQDQKHKHKPQRKLRSPKPKDTPSSPHSTHRAPPPPSSFNLDYSVTKDWLGAEDTLHFARGGLQHRLIQRMKRGQVELEAHIDLHQQTTEEAMDSVSQFIEICVAKGLRWICVIHGKGHYSKEGKPILKNFLNQWLRTHPMVLAFHSAKPKHGGTGALYVLLRKTSQ